MKRKTLFYHALALLLSLSACDSGEKTYDATGSFEAIERLIPAEASGVIQRLDIQEGQRVKVGDTLGYIDVSNLTLQAKQVQASIEALGAKTNDPGPQIAILEAQLLTQDRQLATQEQQLQNVEKEIARFTKLVEANAAPKKQLDDLIAQKRVVQKQLEAVEAQKAVLKAQIASAKKNVSIQNRAILSETQPNQKRLDLIQKQISDGLIVSKHQGTITTQLAYDGEFIATGRPLYKIADLDEITLRVYITGDQLPQVALNQSVTVRTDNGVGGFKETSGTISWISEQAEFTPKTIQTKKERANLVYAIKVAVENDGSYKMGMYGEVIF